MTKEMGLMRLERLAMAKTTKDKNIILDHILLELLFQILKIIILNNFYTQFNIYVRSFDELIITRNNKSNELPQLIVPLVIYIVTKLYLLLRLFLGYIVYLYLFDIIMIYMLYYNINILLYFISIESIFKIVTSYLYYK